MPPPTVPPPKIPRVTVSLSEDICSDEEDDRTRCCKEDDAREEMGAKEETRDVRAVEAINAR